MSKQSKAFGDGARRQGGTLGMAAAVVGGWVMTEYLGVQPPQEVLVAMGGLLTGVGTYIQRNIGG